MRARHPGHAILGIPGHAIEMLLGTGKCPGILPGSHPSAESYFLAHYTGPLQEAGGSQCATEVGAVPTPTTYSTFSVNVTEQFSYN